MCMIFPSSAASSIESESLLSQMWWLLFALAAKTRKILAYIVVSKQRILSVTSSNHKISFQVNLHFYKLEHLIVSMMNVGFSSMAVISLAITDVLLYNMISKQS